MTRPDVSSSAPSLGRLVETIRHLRWRQVASRGWHTLGRAFVRAAARRPQPVPSRRAWPHGLEAPDGYLPPRQIEPGVFRAVGETGRIAAPGDWNAADRSKLWLFNVHYLDDLALAEEPTPGGHAALLDRWIADNPPADGVGWHPYPTSLRLVNVCKWCARHDAVPDRWLRSIAEQAHALAWHVEHQIAANHVFANAKGLVFAGAFLGRRCGDAHLVHGLRLLDAEVVEQFLADGGHYERSPAYHALVLWDLLDLLDLAQASGLEPLTARADAWRGVVARGLAWLSAMTHPDGDPAFFNDTAIGVAPALAQVEARAVRLGCTPPPAADTGWPRVTHLAASGYVSVATEPTTKLIVDVAPIEPAHQPGHAHADTLSFELSVRGRRVVVNSGTSTYAEGAERHRQRSTAAHSTVEIDGSNSSDVWKSFRVGRRARPFAVSVSQSGGTVTIEASHDGYRHLPGRPVHTRRWTCSPGNVSVADRVDGPCGRAVARFHLHPAVEARADRLELPGGESVRWEADPGGGRFVPGTWHPEFGAALANFCLELPVPSGGQRLDLAW